MTLSGFWRAAQDPQRIMHIELAHWQQDDQQRREDYLAVEEPLELRLNGRSLAIIMRTPGNDAELAMGFLFSEGIIRRASDIIAVRDAVDENGLPLVNVIELILREPVVESSKLFERHFTVSSSCGLCGKNSIADLLATVPPLEQDAIQISVPVLYRLAQELQARQAVFQRTGGLHAAGLFSLQGELLLAREDVGRHNAVDKLLGQGLLSNTFPYREQILLVSGRTSYEILQKACYARIPCVVAISAPSSLAVELAESCGITLIGFLRNQSLNVYTHPRRISAQ